LNSTEIFVSYAPKDEQLRDELVKHLAPLNRQGLATTWYNNKIEAGFHTQAETDKHLNSAQIILLLVSADFIASDYLYSTEMQHAIERHKQAAVYVVPVLLRPVYWQDTPLAEFSMLPPGAKAVTTYDDLDLALLDVVMGIARIIKVNIRHDIDTSSLDFAQKVRPVASIYLPARVGNKGVASFFLHGNEHILHFTRIDSIANAFRLKSLSKLKNQTLLLTYNQQELVREEIHELPTLKAIVKERHFQIEGVDCLFTFKMSALGIMSVQVKVDDVIVFSH
jgi:hypothetical protein